ncbi:late competence protein ComER [Halalkalibacterium halodurans]|uniref:Pyrroline-5-carboxylate reductase n=1 Tax=Halalkalibacterium halodurans TaxID=86665 RepID=A0A0M0KLD1_ALKHA|nr:late competence protein ComER [Halalkalibacterium halodurans]MDY7221858.1 late competence protein ComER [Halalkalibacterium halodurans]MDY7241134.1 late competence protein ComER [Halalkalibacterium halodurans]MED4122509.1 late competence protein ComER [Halalkalibacterium halodurans]TES56630.1 late competence protein ComER [Halalkalibacterium halodurans]TPE69071.1 late competence protein ComER [Halalkalibacterium halodurans]
MKIGFIGTGSMGTILIESFLESSALTAEQMVITNRTREKADALARRYPGLSVVDHPEEVVQQTDCFFVCVKPMQFHRVLMDIRPHCSANKLLVSITSPISIAQLENSVDCKVARAIPSILNRAFAGSTLVSFSERCLEEDRSFLCGLLGTISEPLLIEEKITRVSSDIVSCGPAFFSYLTQRFIEAAVRQTAISEEDATVLATEMLIGIGKLLDQELYTLPTLQKRVCVPGGITGEGIRVLEEDVGHMFDRLFQKTHQKYYHEQEKISSQLTLKG